MNDDSLFVTVDVWRYTNRKEGSSFQGLQCGVYAYQAMDNNIMAYTKPNQKKRHDHKEL